MTTTAALPRQLIIAIAVLLALQVAQVIQQVAAAAASATRPPWFVTFNGGASVACLLAVLLGSRYPRAAWVLLSVGGALLAATIVARSQLGA